MIETKDKYFDTELPFELNSRISQGPTCFVKPFQTKSLIVEEQLSRKLKISMQTSKGYNSYDVIDE